MPLTTTSSLNRFGNAVWAITLREFRNRYGTRRLGLFWAFVEPATYIFVISVLMSAIRNTTSPLGGHITPFIATAVMTYMMFNATEGFVRGALKSNRSLLSFPRVKPFDIYVGRLVMEVTTLVVVFTLMFSGFVIFGLSAPPAELHRVFLPLTLAVLLGFSMGIINSSIIAVFSSWGSIYAVLSRVNFFTSGVFFIADSWPPEIRAILYYQPLLHLSEWVRSAWYGHFESRFLDVQFVVGVVATLLCLGLIVERAGRKAVLREL